MFTMFTKRCPKPCLPGEGRISPCWTLELFFEAWLLNSASLKILQNLQEKGGTNCLIRWVYRKIYRKATYLMGKSMVSRFDFPLDQSNDEKDIFLPNWCFMLWFHTWWLSPLTKHLLSN